MPRLARVVVPGLPHHITQRGNRRQQTFFCDEDYRSYLELIGEWCGVHQVAVWAYCLMPNHIHLIAVPQSADGLRRAIGEAHRRYTRTVNFREGWRGHLWQGRFASFVLDEPYLLTAARYVELNPVRAGLINSPSRYPSEQRRGTCARAGRRTGEGCSLAPASHELASLSHQGSQERGPETPSLSRAHWAPTGRRGLSGVAGAESGQDPETAETRPQGKAAEMKKVICVGPSIRGASQEPCRPYGYKPIELSRVGTAFALRGD